MVYRVADESRHHGGEAHELFTEAGLSGDVLLGHGVGAHHAPFVMVVGEPRLADVSEALVRVYVDGAEVAVVVDDGHILRAAMVEPARGLRREKKFFVDEALHYIYLSFAALRRRVRFATAPQNNKSGFLVLRALCEVGKPRFYAFSRACAGGRYFAASALSAFQISSFTGTPSSRFSRLVRAAFSPG